MRDVLIHDYHGVDLPRVWLVVEQDLPLVKAALESELPSIDKLEDEISRSLP